MKIISEKRQVVGKLSTLVGRFSMLEFRHSKSGDIFRFNVIDDEGFDNWIQVRADFVIIPSAVPTVVDVKRVATDEEAQLISISVPETVE